MKVVTRNEKIQFIKEASMALAGVFPSYYADMLACSPERHIDDEVEVWEKHLIKQNISTELNS